MGLSTAARRFELKEKRDSSLIFCKKVYNLVKANRAKKGIAVHTAMGGAINELATIIKTQRT